MAGKNRAKLVYELLRVKQWIKNAFIFFPLLFSGHFLSGALFGNVLIAFSGFCLVCSGMYIANDFIDRDRDRQHPSKAGRPIAQGLVSVPVVGMLIATFLLLGLLICSLAGQGVLALACVYIAIHVFYNVYTKHVVILDVIFVALGFQIRIWAGAVAVGILPSVWLQLCVFLLALFLGFTKRRYELSLLKDGAVLHRDVLSEYRVYLLDQIIVICSTLAVVFYGLYTISPEVVSRVGGYQMAYTVVFVIYGMFRYLYLIHVKETGGDAGEVLATDGPSLLNVLLWIAMAAYIIYWF